MEAKKKKRKVSDKGAILAKCPECKGTGKVPRGLPFRANPRAPATHAGKLGLQTCPRCNGAGRVGAE